MELILEYAGHPVEFRGSRARHVPAMAIPILLSYGHLNLCWRISELMLVPVYRHVGTPFFLWTPLAWLPGCATTLWAGPLAGAVIMFLMSVLAGCATQSVLERYRQGFPGGIGAAARDWHVWLATLLWVGWIPVPATVAFVFQFGTWAINVR